MKKYTGDGILKGSITVYSPKPLDDRLVVESSSDLDSLGFTYLGMIVVCSSDDSVWMLTSEGWKNLQFSGKSAYLLAVDNGFEGTLQEWLESLLGGVDLQTLLNLATKQYVQESIQSVGYSHVFLTLEEYNSLQEKDSNTLYFIIKPTWGLGDNLPIILASD